MKITYVQTKLTLTKRNALEIFDEKYFVYDLPEKKQSEH